MTPKSKNILVGIFVVFFSIGAISLTTWLGSTAIQEETVTYLSYLDEAVSGLSENSPVKYKGVNIGQVQEIRINPDNSNQIELRLMIKRGTPIKVDSKLILTAQGITGLQYVEITGGSEGLPLLEKKPGERFPVIPAGQSTLATVQAAIGPILSNINLTIDDIRKILKTTNAENLTEILSDIQKVTGAFAENADGIFRDISETSSSLQQVIQQSSELVNNTNTFLSSRQDQVVNLISKFNESTTTLNRLMLSIENEDIIPKIGQTVSHVNRTLNQIEQEKVIDNIGQTIARVDQLVETMDHQVNGQLGTLLRDLNQSTNTLNSLLGQMEQQNVVQGVNNVVEEASHVVKKMEQLVDNVNTQVTNKELQSIPQEIQTTLQDIQRVTRTLHHIAEDADVASMMEKLEVTMEEIQTFAQTWREVAETMENQPSALIFGESKQEIKVMP